MNKDAKRLLIYLLLSFGLTWAWFLFSCPKGIYWDDMARERQNFVALGMLFPVISHVLTRRITKEGLCLSGRDSMMLGISFKNRKWICFLLAILFPWIYMELGNGITLLLDPASLDSGYYLTLEISKRMLTILPLSAMVGGAVGSFAAFGEESGWRGYMMPKLMKLMPKAPALIVGGIIWGLWHAPLTCIGHNFGTNYPGFHYVGIIQMCIFCILVGIMLTFFTEMSGSVWPAAILHAVNNSRPSILNGYINPEKEKLILGMSTSFFGTILAMLIVDAVLIIVWKRKEKVFALYSSSVSSSSAVSIT